MNLLYVVRPSLFRGKQTRTGRGGPGLWLDWLECRQLLSQVFVVTNTLDTKDPGSFRLAMTEVANDNSKTALDPDQIHFAIPTTDPGYNPVTGTWKITANTPLPQSGSVVIDGYTQPGATPNTSLTSDNAIIKIELTGGVNSFNGLRVGDHSIVRGMAIGGFLGPTIDLFDNVTGSSLLEGNFLGTDPSGSVGIGDNQGVLVEGPFDTIGGTTPAARNVISGAIFADIALGQSSRNCLVQGNFIGLAASGNQVIANTTSDAGIEIGAGGVPGGSANTIGGTVAGAGNVIAGIHSRGIWDSELVGHNLFQGNRIGTDSTGTISLPNGSGIEIQGLNDTVGGTTSGAGNTIASSVGTGITLDMTFPYNPNPTGVVISGNSIFGNGKLGIDLGGDGVTANRPGGPFAGSNDNQNYPTLIAAQSTASSTTIFGTLNSLPNSTYTIQFFSNPAADPSGYGQGQFYLGQITGVATDASGNAQFSMVVPFATTGQFLTATTINPLGDTSEFSHDIPEGAIPLADLTVSSQSNTPTTTIKSGVNFTDTITNRGPSAATNVMVSDLLPPSLANLSASASLGQFSLIGGQFTDRIDSLPSGGSFTVSFSATATSAGTITNELTAVASEVDPNPTNNTATVSIQVDLAPTTTTLVATPNPAALNQSVTFVATVATNSSGFAPTGTMTFFIDGLPFAVPLVAGLDGNSSQATLMTSSLGVGTHNVSASYGGDSIFAPSSTTIATQTVNPAATSTTLVSAPNPALVGESITFSATVSGPAPLGGTVTFFDGTTPIGFAPVTASGQAQFTTSLLSAGIHAVFARFDGTANLQPSASAAMAEGVIAKPIVSAGPTVSAVQRYGYHAQPTTLVVTFDQPLDPSRAQEPANYQIVGPDHKHIRVVKAIEPAGGQTVTLHLNSRLNLHQTYHLTIIGSTPGGLTNAIGVPLDGSGNGRPGTDYQTTITIKNLVLPHKASQAIASHSLQHPTNPPVAVQFFHGKTVPRIRKQTHMNR